MSETGTEVKKKGSAARITLRVIFLVLSVGTMALIFWFSAQDSETSSEQSSAVADVIVPALEDAHMYSLADFVRDNIRKIAHVFLYACLGACIGIFMYTFKASSRGVWLLPLIAFALCFIYAYTDELHQTFSQGRTSTFTDVLIDSAGAAATVVISFLVYYFAVFRRGRKKKRVACEGGDAPEGGAARDAE